MKAFLKIIVQFLWKRCDYYVKSVWQSKIRIVKTNQDATEQESCFPNNTFYCYWKWTLLNQQIQNERMTVEVQEHLWVWSTESNDRKWHKRKAIKYFINEIFVCTWKCTDTLNKGKKFYFHHCQTSDHIKLVYELALLILSELMSQIASVDFNNNLRKQM